LQSPRPLTLKLPARCALYQACNNARPTHTLFSGRKRAWDCCGSRRHDNEYRKGPDPRQERDGQQEFGPEKLALVEILWELKNISWWQCAGLLYPRVQQTRRSLSIQDHHRRLLLNGRDHLCMRDGYGWVDTIDGTGAGMSGCPDVGSTHPGGELCGFPAAGFLVAGAMSGSPDPGVSAYGPGLLPNVPVR
jgi:hypothetical protein